MSPFAADAIIGATAMVISIITANQGETVLAIILLLKENPAAVSRRVTSVRNSSQELFCPETRNF